MTPGRARRTLAAGARQCRSCPASGASGSTVTTELPTVESVRPLKSLTLAPLTARIGCAPWASICGACPARSVRAALDPGLGLVLAACPGPSIRTRALPLSARRPGPT